MKCWVLNEKMKTLFPLRKNKIYPSIKRIQFPFIRPLEWTVHKVQGMSLDEDVISFNPQRQKSFNQGQTHVALNRTRSIEKMLFVGNYNFAPIKKLNSRIRIYSAMKRKSVRSHTS